MVVHDKTRLIGWLPNKNNIRWMLFLLMLVHFNSVDYTSGMNNGEFESRESERLEDLMLEIYEDNLLLISTQQAELYDLVELGNYGLHEVKIGETEYVTRAAIKSPILNKVYKISLKKYSEVYKLDNRKEEIITDKFKDAALSLNKEPVNPEEKITCVNCRGQAQFTYNCSCIDGGVVLTDFELNETTQLRQVGLPDSNCRSCSGTGEHTTDCMTCAGTGLIYKYPKLTLVNDATGQYSTELLDVASLITSGKLLIASTYEGVRIEAKLPELMQNMGKFVGIQSNSVVGVGVYGNYELGNDNYGVNVHPLGNTRCGPSKDTSTSLTQHQIIEQLQRNVSYLFARKSTNVLDSKGVARGVDIRVVEKPNVTNLLNELVEIIEYKDFRLGFTKSFIATGETGPSFIILDKDMQSVCTLATEYSLSFAIINAHQKALTLLTDM
jgi:hypothetical protein